MVTPNALIAGAVSDHALGTRLRRGGGESGVTNHPSSPSADQIILAVAAPLTPPTLILSILGNRLRNFSSSNLG